MADIAFIFKGFEADLSVLLDDLATDDGLETAVSISLFSDRRASPNDVLSDRDLFEGRNDKRGCWLDTYPEVEGDLIGSRLWLLHRAKSQQVVVNRAGEIIAEALQWMIDDGVASRVESDVFFTDRDRLCLVIDITRPLFANQGREVVSLRFEVNWLAQALKR